MHAQSLGERGCLLARPAMNASNHTAGLCRDDLELIRAVAAPFELMAMLKKVTSAAQRVLRAERAPINVPDCSADPRFDPPTDRRAGFRTRCSLTLPLIDHRDALVGVMQVISRHDGIVDGDDEALAHARAAQCAMVPRRVRMMVPTLVWSAQAPCRLKNLKSGTAPSWNSFSSGLPAPARLPPASADG